MWKKRKPCQWFLSYHWLLERTRQRQEAIATSQFRARLMFEPVTYLGHHEVETMVRLLKEAIQLLEKENMSLGGSILDILDISD